MLKVCTKCGSERLLTEFYKCASAKDGLQKKCKTCEAAYKQANADRIADYQKSYYQNNAERISACVMAYRKANPDRVAEWRQAYSPTYAERRAKLNQAWYSVNFKRKNDLGRVWDKANPDAKRIHRQTRRARKLGACGTLSHELSEKLFKLQRGMCACGCKQPLGDDYHRDHIMPLALGGTNTDDNIQLLRKICNLQKSAKHPVDFMQQRGFLL